MLDKKIENIKKYIAQNNLKPQEAAKYLLKKLEIDTDRMVKLNEVVNKLNLEVIQVDSIPTPKNKEGKIWGLLYYKDNQPKIILSKEIPYLNSTRFTLAHEIAHFILDKPGTIDIAYRKKFVFDMNEQKYNIFAINLLIPSWEHFFELRKNMSLPQIANYYGVPLTLVEIYERDLKVISIKF